MKYSHESIGQLCSAIDLEFMLPLPLAEIGQCVVKFGASLSSALSSPRSTFKALCLDVVTEVENCLLSADVTVGGGLSPVEKVYVRLMVGLLASLRYQMCQGITEGKKKKKKKIKNKY